MIKVILAGRKLASGAYTLAKRIGQSRLLAVVAQIVNNELTDTRVGKGAEKIKALLDFAKANLLLSESQAQDVENFAAVLVAFFNVLGIFRK